MKNYWVPLLFASMIIFLVLIGIYGFGILNLKNQEEKDFFVTILLFCEVVAFVSILGLSFPKFLLKKVN